MFQGNGDQDEWFVFAQVTYSEALSLPSSSFIRYHLPPIPVTCTVLGICDTFDVDISICILKLVSAIHIFYFGILIMLSCFELLSR